MKTEIKKITPTLAKTMLERNTENRPVRRGHVKSIADAITRGEWKVTHQGIAFAKDGRLLDGQHRLAAIAEANIAVMMMVSWDVDEEAFFALDQGLKRAASDILDIPQRLAAVARLVAFIFDGTRSGAVTPQQMIPYVEAFREPYDDLVAYCPMFRKTWSTSTVQSAAIIRMLDGEDRDYVKLVYHALVHLEFDMMPPIAQSLYRQVESGKVRGSIAVDMYARCLKVFSRDLRNTTRIQMNGTDSALAYTREVVAREVFGKKTASPKAGAKKVETFDDFIANHA